MIIDRRPDNTTEMSFETAFALYVADLVVAGTAPSDDELVELLRFEKMPHGCQFVDCFPPNARFDVWADDASQWYYRLWWSPALTARNALGEPVGAPALLAAARSLPAARRAQLKSELELAGAPLLQFAQQSITRAGGGLLPQSWLTNGFPPPTDPALQGEVL